MQAEFEQVMQQFAANQALDLQMASRFTAAEFRHGIQWLVAHDKTQLALALADAGLSFYPHSEDILAIAGLLAMTQESWPLAIELLEDLRLVQGDAVQAMTYHMLGRAYNCNLDPAEAQRVLAQGLIAWPNDATLLAEQDAMVPSENAFVAASRLN